MNELNPVGMCGIEFTEFSGPNPDMLHNLFVEFGFSRLMKNTKTNVDYYKQADIHFLLNRNENSIGTKFSKLHGPSISAMGWRVADSAKALEVAVSRGAKAADGELEINGKKVPAIYGIGDSLIYFVDTFSDTERYAKYGFERHPEQVEVQDKGFILIDHLTNNVEKGTMQTWADFYKNVFGFTEVRYFDIRGAKTGLTSYALKSPCGSFCIPINEGSEQKSQINEYLDEYKGPGVQHIAFLTHDIVQSLDKLKGTSIKTLDIDDEYYEEVWDRVPFVTEDREKIKNHQILVDGDEQGYLLQIFTKNIIGPIFVEIIQRKNHFSFGEGNFGALFRSIEKDQEKRGYLD